MFQSLPNLYDQVNSGLYYGNLDFNFNVDAEKTLLSLGQMYLNVHYHLKHVSRFACLQHLDMIKLRLGFVLLLLTFCLSLLPLWKSVIVLCFVVRCCTLLYVHSSIAIILMGKRELIALLNLSSWSSWFLVVVERLFLAVPRGYLQFVIVVIPDHTHYFGGI